MREKQKVCTSSLINLVISVSVAKNIYSDEYRKSIFLSTHCPHLRLRVPFSGTAEWNTRSVGKLKQT